MENNIVLRLKNITKRYPGVLALNHFSLDLRVGEVHALVGENGAGKSTLIKCLSGAVIPEEGIVEINGTEYEGVTPKISREHGIEVVYQELNLIESLTVAENVCFGKKYGKMVNFKILNQITENIFKEMGVQLDPQKYVFALSTAQQQLVEIAKSISKDVKILVLDEPTAPLTNNEVDVLFQIIEKLKQKNVSIIYISHRLDEIFRIADRVTVMRDGEFRKTMDVAATNRQELIRYMVGRELKETYPARRNITNEVMLEVDSVNGMGDKDITLHVNKGEIVGLAGLVGAGRTELARMLIGADKMVSGIVKIDGKEVLCKSPKHAIKNGIGLIPEDRKRQGALLNFGIDWNISLAHLPSISKYIFVQNKKIKEEAENYIKILKIKTPFVNQLVRNLSGGNQQKVVLAKMLATNSSVLIFDEPTRGIDVGAKNEIYQLMTQLADEGKAILMISSDMEELLGMSDRIYTLAEGKLTGELLKEDFSQVRVLELMSSN